ncbi:MAG: zinc ribbon domain-containing protein [Ruminococcus sp.]
MKPFDIFKKTMTFVWIRLGINLAISVGVILWAILWVAIATAIGHPVAGLLALIAIVASTKLVGLAQQYAGYMIKSAQIAVIAETFRTGTVPDQMVQFGKEQVKGKFATANVYILLDKLVSGSVRQINKVVNTSVGWIENIIPQASFLTNILKKFTTLTLTYVDECCLCYTFMKDDQSPFKSAADGVVIYFQNWKGLLKSSAKGTGIAILVELIVGVIIFLLALAVVKLFGTGFGWIVALIVAICLVYSLRDAFLGSYMMIYTMENFNREVQTGKISVDLYGKLCGMSKKFKELFEKGNDETVQQPAFAAVGGVSMDGTASSTQTEKHCDSCGAEVPLQSQFCPNCGKQV